MEMTKLEALRKDAIAAIENTLQEMCESEDINCQKKASVLSYWLVDYMRFLKKETSFNPKEMIKYQRGDIVKAHLGYNIGSEQGGLHYGVVIDNNSSNSASTLTIIPLSSIRSGRKIHHTSVEIGNEVFKSIMSKHDKLENEINSEIETLNKELADLHAEILRAPQLTSNEDSKKVETLALRVEELYNMTESLKVLKTQIIKMKEGSVALTNQITTISKIRIYDPITSADVLYGVRLAPATLSKINSKIKDLYIYSE